MCIGGQLCSSDIKNVFLMLKPLFSDIKKQKLKSRLSEEMTQDQWAASCLGRGGGWGGVGEGEGHGWKTDGGGQSIPEWGSTKEGGWGEREGRSRFEHRYRDKFSRVGECLCVCVFVCVCVCVCVCEYVIYTCV